MLLVGNYQAWDRAESFRSAVCAQVKNASAREIRHIDTSAAKATHGVYSVVTGEDILRVIPDPYFGPAFHDQPILALGKVRFAGEPVAVVLAEDPKIAEAAAQKISIDYEELPAVLDEVETLIATTFVHEALKPAGMFADFKASCR
jgi:CO/xanthine dehydrogenase Mo-binding subunit